MFHLDMPIGDKKIKASRTEDIIIQISTFLGSFMKF